MENLSKIIASYLHFVVVILSLGVWIVRLGDKVDSHEKFIMELKAQVEKSKKIEWRIHYIEEKIGIKTPYLGE